MKTDKRLPHLKNDCCCQGAELCARCQPPDVAFFLRCTSASALDHQYHIALEMHKPCDHTEPVLSEPEQK